MMLRDVKINITDGGLGASSVKGEGAHVKIGISPIVSTAPITITGGMNVKKIKEKLGNSPLADSCMDSVSAGSNVIYCIPVQASTDGTVGEITKTGTGKGTCTIEGKPNNSYDVELKFIESGGFNKATFKYSIDGGYSFSDETTLPVGGSFELPETGLTLKFTEDADANSSFMADDVIKFSTIAPQMTNQDVLSALGKLKNSSLNFEYIHVVGESTKALWAALAVEAEKFFNTYFKPIFFVLEARNKNADETVDEYAQSLISERKGLVSYFIQVVTARALYTKMDGSIRDVNGASIVCGLYSRADVQQSIGETRTFPISGILKLLPEGIEDNIGALDEAKYLTFRQYVGLEGFYVTNARMMAVDGSDYKYAERVRVSNKLVRETRKEALLQIQSQVDMADPEGSLESIAKFIQIPGDTMVRQKEISSVRIVIPEGQDILGTEKLNLKIRYIPIGHIREIEIDMGMENPLLS